MLESLQTLYCGGADVDWAGFDRGHRAPPRRAADLSLPAQAALDRRSRRRRASRSTAPSAGRGWRRRSTARPSAAPLDLDVASYPAQVGVPGAADDAAHAIATLRDAGLFDAAGERHTVDAVLARAGIGATYRHLMQRWLAGPRRRRSAASRTATPSVPIAAAARPGSRRRCGPRPSACFADNQPLLDYVRHCGTLRRPMCCAAARARSRRCSPAARSNSRRPLRALGDDALHQPARRRRLRAARRADAARPPAARAGGRRPAPAARRRRCCRCCRPSARAIGSPTSASVFLDRARAALRRAAGRRVRPVRPRRRRSSAGLRAGQLRRDRRRPTPCTRSRICAPRCAACATLLAPGGVLMLVESTTHLAWFDMTTGLIEGWQHFADDLRGDNPLLPPPTWIEALRTPASSAARAWPEAGRRPRRSAST